MRFNRHLISMLVLAGMFFPLFAKASHTNFSGTAYQTINETWRQLMNYGLLRFNAWDPMLPRPMVPASEAVVSRRVGLLVYYDEETLPFGTTLVFKNPDGGQRHSISFNSDEISFLTPFAGTVATAKRFVTVTGPGVNFYCQSTPVTEQGFYSCIQSLYINVIVNQLKKFAR